MAATALIATGLIGGAAQGLMGGLMQRQGQENWEKSYNMKFQQMENQFILGTRQLDLTARGQDISMMSTLGSSGISGASGIIGALINSYTTSRNLDTQLDYMSSLNTQRRNDLQNDGLPLSYLHLGGNTPGLIPPPMRVEQTMGRSVSNYTGFANSGGSTYSQKFGPPPPYSARADPNHWLAEKSVNMDSFNSSATETE